MASAGRVEVVFTANTHTLQHSMLDAGSRIQIVSARGPAAKRNAYDEMYGRHVLSAADALDRRRCERDPLDPRRLLDIWHARALRAWTPKGT